MRANNLSKLRYLISVQKKVNLHYEKRSQLLQSSDYRDCSLKRHSCTKL